MSNVTDTPRVCCMLLAAYPWVWIWLSL